MLCHSSRGEVCAHVSVLWESLHISSLWCKSCSWWEHHESVCVSPPPWEWPGHIPLLQLPLGTETYKHSQRQTIGQRRYKGGMLRGGLWVNHFTPTLNAAGYVNWLHTDNDSQSLCFCYIPNRCFGRLIQNFLCVFNRKHNKSWKFPSKTNTSCFKQLDVFFNFLLDFVSFFNTISNKEI